MAVAGCGGASRSETRLLADNPNVDEGGPLGGRLAPNFTLTDEGGHKISLRAYRGKVVVLSFNDSQCTTICPLTTQAMLDAKRSLGP
ncbi:MAG TPA: redoxin domain-containing protein, partial [Solirubrobacteraceae bacterium]|nr:redoxin domain-containing protein [Solirubrobacteraceae bacterium]